MMILTIKHISIQFILYRRIFLLFILCTLFSQEAISQLINVPINRSFSSESVKKNTQARKKASTLDLPFWDDFSFTPTNILDDTLAGFPLDSLWEESTNVWVSNGIGFNAPTLNAASLDGLNSTGHVYSTQPTSNGMRDTLTSRPIDLSESKVSLPERTSVYLSFFYQWKGNGEAPDAQDYFKVEFYNSSAEWITVATILTKNSFLESVFYDTLIQVSGAQFFHDQFRFRFRNYGRQSGQFDTWNIDYVYLNKGRSAADDSYNDGALASELGPLFGDYYSVPFSHFKESPLLKEVEVDVLSLRGSQADPYSYRTTGTFTNYVDEIPLSNTILLTPLDRPVRPGNPLLNHLERHRIISLASDLPDPEDQAQFNPDADSAFIKLQFLLLSNDNSFYLSNDTVSAEYVLKDYYAYDDGSAEYAVILNEPDDEAAYRFDKLGASEDQLIAFDVFIPHHSINGFTTADFFVMNTDENGAPNEIISSVTQVLKKTTRDSFQRVILTKPVNISGSFFIGWRGSFSSTLQIGKDAGNNTGDKIYVNPSGSWVKNTTVEGSLMIRPIFGLAGPITGIEKGGQKFSAYPNPSRGTFYVEGMPESIEIHTISGQPVRFEQKVENEKIEITLPSPTTGMYILRVRKGRTTETKKIAIF
jgi:hypothetical protein